MNFNKSIILEIVLSSFIALLTIALIVLMILLVVKRPKKFSEFKINDVTITCLESFDFIDDKEEPEYPHENLGLTGKLILDCYTGTCIKEIFHKDIRYSCDDDGCDEIDKSWTEYRPIIDYDCSEQCYNYGKEECNCSAQYHEKGTCKRKIDDHYENGKICYTYNAIYFWKGKKYKILTTHDYYYLTNVKLKDEECPQGTKNCGIVDDNENKLCISTKYRCPINYISENEINGNTPYSSIKFSNKTFYYGNDNTIQNRKIIFGLIADTDLDLNKDNDKKELIDTYTISGFLEDNKNLYKDINLGYDPYQEKDIDRKGSSYLRAYYNTKNINLTSLRQRREKQYYNNHLNDRALNPIKIYTRIIAILGLIICFILLIAFIVIIIRQCKIIKKGYSREKKKDYISIIVFFLVVFITPLILGCLNIKKINKAKALNQEGNYNTFKNLDICFVIIGFILFLFLIIYLIIIPIKANDKKEVNDTQNDIKNKTNV